MSNNLQPIPDQDIPIFARIVANAYPSIGLNSAESIERFVERMTAGQQDPITHLYGLYHDGRMVAGMRLFDFSMNVFGTPLLAGGVGLVAVDLAHKKRHAAKELISGFLRHYYDQGASLTTLYPFRPDFYKRMGFGYGTKLDQYRVKPADFPSSGARQQVRMLAKQDQQALADCYGRFFAGTHGMIAKRPAEVDIIFDTFENRVAGYEEDGILRGYCIFQFKTGPNFSYYDIEIHECIYESRAALLGLLAFINSQSDQVRTVRFNTQDQHFHHLLADPRNGTENILPYVYHESHTTGVGLMYRVINTPRLFESLAEHRFGRESCTLKITLHDSFFPENDGSTIVRFDAGRPTLQPAGPHDVEIILNVAEFSSLVLGVTPFRRLYDYGLAELSDPHYLPLVNHIFLADEPPICTTRF